MSVTYPLNGILYSAEDAQLFHCTRTSGVFSSEQDFPVSITDDTQLTIGPGLAWIQPSRFAGLVAAFKDSTVLDLPLADGNLPRIDRVVLRYDKLASATSLLVLSGTASSSPASPAITRTETVYDLALYDVYRAAGSLTVTAANITSLLLDEDLCGVMRDGVESIPTDQLLASAQARIDALEETASTSAAAASASEQAAAASEAASKSSETNAASSAAAAAASASSASTSEAAASGSATAAAQSEANAAASEQVASEKASAAQQSAADAAGSRQAVAESAAAAAASEANAAASASNAAASEAAAAASQTSAAGSAEAAASSKSAAESSAAAASASETSAASSASTATAKATAASASATASAASEANAAESERISAEYMEQVKTITTGANGYYATPEALRAAVPLGSDGWWAVVGSTDTIWVWDSDTGDWVDSHDMTQLGEYYTRDQIDAFLAIANALATTSTDGRMSAADKAKLDGIAEGANKYTHPAYTAKTAGLYKITVDGTGHVSAATAAAKADITALGIPAQDTVYTHPTTSGNKHIPSGGASGQILKWSADGTAQWAAANVLTSTAGTAVGALWYE